MSKILTIDVGAGTMDVLYTDTESGLHYKAVVRSPVSTLADRVRSADGKLLILGTEMGGGAVTQAVKQLAAREQVVISTSAAATISHDTEKVRSLGLDIVSDRRARELETDGGLSVVAFCDLEIDRLRRIVETFGVPFAFDVVGACAQDHGVAPKGVSHLDYRHNHYKPMLDEKPYPHALLHRGDEVPEDMSRLRSIAAAARELCAGEVYVMDSGMAAILGASMDPRVRRCRKSLVLDVATSHTVAAALQDGELCGFVEYHTRDVRPERIDALLQELADGRLRHQRVLAEGGHGAYTRRPLGFDSVEVILATGPKRGILAGSKLEIELGAPFGDNMMTGTVGLLEAIRRREGWAEISYA
jgi:uncharacterized protein (DUF1786 family)